MERPLRPELKGRPHYELVRRFGRDENLMGRYVDEKAARNDRWIFRRTIHGGKYEIRYCEA